MNKRDIILLLCIIASTMLYSQVPRSIKYQVAVHNSHGLPVANSMVSLRISIIQDSVNGQEAFIETHVKTTNVFGLLNIHIGRGDSVLNDLADLFWDMHQYFIKLEVDTTGGTDYCLLGTTQMLNVPKALHASSSGILLMTEAERDAIQNPKLGMQVYVSDNDCLSIYNGRQWVEICEFNCGNLYIDRRDLAEYPTVLIGKQCWMAKNMNVGVLIPGSPGSGPSPMTDNGIIEKYCPMDLESNCDLAGGYYEWDEMMNYANISGAQGICPDGWHLPSDEDWKILEGNVDSQYGPGNIIWDIVGARGTDAGGNLKDTSKLYWKPPNTGATNSSRFKALPVGLALSGIFAFGSEDCIFWTSSMLSTSDAWCRRLSYNTSQVFRVAFPKNYGLSVRCLMDNVQ